MKRILLLSVLLLVAAGALVSQPAFAGDLFGRSYEVTITNLTRDQTFSPPVVISHNAHFQLFTPGMAASPGLIALAEGGATMPLIAELDLPYPVFDYDVADGGIGPGQSDTLVVKIRGRSRFISLASMLICSNDAFLALRNVPAPSRGETVITGDAWDAGSEANSELEGDVPCLPNGNAHAGADPAGFVHIHSGINGGEDLDPALYDWNNPVAEIRIRPVLW